MSEFRLWVLIKAFKFAGFDYLDVYAPNDEVVAITATNSLEYLDKLAEIEISQS